MDKPFRIHNATCLMARDAVSKDRQDRETEVCKAGGAVEYFFLYFLPPESKDDWKRK